MDIHEQREGAVTVLKPMGPILQGEADQFRSRLGEAMTRSLGRMVVDVSAVAYVDSKGLETLAEAAEEFSSIGGALKLCGANETLREVLDVTELTPMFEHFADVQTAIRSFL